MNIHYFHVHHGGQRKWSLNTGQMASEEAMNTIQETAKFGLNTLQKQAAFAAILTQRRYLVRCFSGKTRIHAACTKPLQ